MGLPDDKPPLRAIPGSGSGRKPWSRTGLDQSEQVTCWKCEVLRGVATSAVVKVTIAPRRAPTGRKTGGTDVWACAYCLARGEITELIRA